MFTLKSIRFFMLCYVSLCQCSMEQPWVADGGDDLQIWRVTANILNKQLWTTDKEWSSSLEVGWEANTSPL